MNTRNTLGDMHDLMMEEIERLMTAEGEDLKTEISRSKAVAELSTVVINNAKTVLDVARIQAQTAVQIPRMLTTSAPCDQHEYVTEPKQ